MEKGFIALIGLMFLVSAGIVSGIVPPVGWTGLTKTTIELDIKRNTSNKE